MFLAAVIFFRMERRSIFFYLTHWTGHASTRTSSYWRYDTLIDYFGHAIVIYMAFPFFTSRIILKTSLLIIFVRSTAPPRIVITLAILMPVVTAPNLRFVRQQPKPY